jgi:CheY-like chemotaxis protein
MKTILVIEDVKGMRENITEILHLAPYKVVQAANGKEGIEIARKTHPDLILCDIMMPELDGYGVLHILNNDPNLANIPFLFLTAKIEPGDFRFGMNLGADDYLTKPFDDLSLLNAVELRLKKGKTNLPAKVGNTAGLENLTKAILNAEDARHFLVKHYQTIHYKKKHTLFGAGSSPMALYFISKGKIKLSQFNASGNEYITTLCGEGDFLGYLALLEEVAYAETAEIIEDAEVVVIPKADFMTLIFQNQQVANHFVRMLASDVSEHQQQLLKLAYQSVRKRLAEALLMYERKFHSQTDETAGVMPNKLPPAIILSRENWSHLVGASTETVIRILSDFRAEGLIDITDTHITLLDVDKLTRLKR